MITIIQVTLWIALITDASQSTSSWKGITPLHSSRGDVERVLGAPSDACTELCHYQTRTEKVFVRYSEERCKRGEANPLDIPSNIVVSLTVYPEVKPALRSLRLNLKEFTKTKDPELQGHWIYTNAEQGVTYEVSNKNRVLSTEWFGAAKDLQSLRCRER